MSTMRPVEGSLDAFQDRDVDAEDDVPDLEHTDIPSSPSLTSVFATWIASCAITWRVRKQRYATTITVNMRGLEVHIDTFMSAS